jgi:hypothetical protein
MIEISIPSWSDFNLSIRSLYVSHFRFQSHLGLISTDAFLVVIYSYPRFQSHLGLISTL